jgi:pimeloyl-ACP methyl ester carboxylesterase
VSRHSKATGQIRPVRSSTPETAPVSQISIQSGADWAAVQEEVAPDALFCSVGRSNTTGNLSDDGANPRSAADLMHDGWAALEAARLPGHYLVVGHSNAGMAAQLFVAEHSSDSAGLVLLDAQSEYFVDQIAERLTRYDPTYVTAWIEAFTASPGSEPDHDRLRSARLVGPSPTVPTVLIRHGMADPSGVGLPTEIVPAQAQEDTWTATQDQLAAYYGAPEPSVATGIGHDIYTEAPQLVTDAITKILARDRCALPFLA